MEPRTVIVATAIIATLVVAAIVGATTTGGTLEERWVSDTPRDNRVNHHPVGVGGDSVIIVPVSEVAGHPDMRPTSCALVRLDPATGEVLWRAGMPPENCTSHALTGPTIADVDRDGDLEAAVASTERALHVLATETGEEAWRVPLETFGYGPPAVADLRGGPALEIVVSDIKGSVSLVANRTIQWRRALDSSTWASPIVADVTGDGTPEIVVGTNDRVVVLAPEGDRVWAVPADAETTTLVPRTDGPPLVVAGGTAEIRALEGPDGSFAWNVTGSWTASVGAVRTGPGGTTLYAGLSSGRIVAIDARSGERRWLTRVIRTERSVTPPPVLGDLNGDGTVEVVAVTGPGTVAVLDPDDGSELASYERDVPILTRATVADVTGDGAAEVFVRYGDGRVVSLAYG